MATINTTAIFPSAKFLETDALGDLQEVSGANATTANLTHDGLTFTSEATGVEGNLISVEIVGSNDATGLAFSLDGSKITLTAETADLIPATPDTPATADALTSDGVTYTAVNAGANSGLEVTINESQVADAISVTGSVLTIDLDDVIGNKTQGDISTLFASAPQSVTDVFDIAVADATGALSILLTNEALTGGTDLIPGDAEVPAVTIANYTQGQVLTAFGSAGADITGLVDLAVANSATNLVSLLSETNLSGGSDSSSGDLEPNETYLCIKQSELHDLTQDETSDGRKLVWGIVHKASQVFDGLAEQPANFTISRGVPTSIDGGSALRQTYTIRATYQIANLDLKSEA
jgi:hypothetical protein